MLSELNALRVKLGRTPLKAWKASKAKLGEQVALLRNEAATAKVKDSKKKVVDKPAKRREGVSLVDIAKDCDVEDRAARQKFRRLYAADEKGLPKTIGDQWVFAAGDVSAVKKLLMRDRRVEE